MSISFQYLSFLSGISEVRCRVSAPPSAPHVVSSDTRECKQSSPDRSVANGGSIPALQQFL